MPPTIKQSNNQTISAVILSEARRNEESLNLNNDEILRYAQNDGVGGVSSPTAQNDEKAAHNDGVTRHSDPERSEGEESQTNNEMFRFAQHDGMARHSERSEESLNLNTQNKDSSPTAQNDGKLRLAADGTFAENFLIKGNNLIALHSLKRRYRGKVKLIYIDPPYNTGNDSFNYNDRFNHSVWLTFMKNRLEIARELLRDDGVIFVQCDDNEQAYLKVLMDEIFGRENFVSCVAVRSSTPSGLKTAHREKTIIKTKDFILFYSKQSENIKLKPQYTKKDKYDTHYNGFFDKETMTSKRLLEVMIENKILKVGDTLDNIDINNKRHKEFYIKYANYIYRTAPEMPKEWKEFSKSKPNEIISYEGENGEMQYAIDGRRFSFLIKKIKPVFIGANIENDLSNLLCDFWNDIDFQNTQNQGGVSFENAKKPEQLIYRIIDMTTNENDIVLDFFAGSGTTLAVAHKMNRRYIGIEQMEYIESITLERLKKVIDAEQGGISKAVSWQGGGSVIYAELMPLNAVFKAKIDKATTLDELKAVLKEMQEKAFWEYRLDREKLNGILNTANTIRHSERSEESRMIEKDSSLDAQNDGVVQNDGVKLGELKALLKTALDSNMDYVLYGDIDDSEYKIDDATKAFNKAFYGDL